MISTRAALLAVAAGFLLGCQDTRLPTDAGPGNLTPLISDGAHTDPNTNELGNSHFFFLPPMVPNPDIPLTETFNLALTPQVFICEFNGRFVAGQLINEPSLDPTLAKPLFCADGGMIAGSAARAFGPFDAPRVDDEEHYIFHWQTVNDALLIENPDASGDEVFYRVFVVAAGEEVGFADVDVEGTQAQLNLVNTDNFVPLFIDRTLPVKFFVGAGFVCEARGLPATQCGDGFSDFDNGIPDVITLNNSGVSIPDQPQSFQVGAITVIITPCSSPTNLPIDLPRFGTCFDIETFPELEDPLPVEAIVFSCFGGGLAAIDGDVITSDAQLELLTVHRQDATGEIQALPHADAPCSTVVVASLPQGKGLLRYARAGWNALTGMAASLFAPEALYAKRFRRGDEGPGGEAGEFSRFQIALPSKIDVFAGDAQVAPVGTVLGTDPTVIVTDANGAAVSGATVRFTSPAPDALANPTPDGSVSAPKVVVTGADGKASVSWTLSSTPGANELDVFGRGLAGPTDSPRPFAPPVPNDGSPAVTVETGVLTFSAIGCEPGDAVGTADLDGAIDADEWACADSQDFIANLSGGDTPATLYWMSDTDNLYLAVRVERDQADKVNTVRFNFDNNNSENDATGGGAAAEQGDDIIFFDADDGFGDHFLTLKCTNSSQASCGKSDDEDTAKGGELPPNGTVDGSGAFSNDGTFSMYELAHPLSSGDTHDFNLAAGDMVGLFLTLQLGNGAQGNTQFPGFRIYLEITIAN